MGREGFADAPPAPYKRRMITPSEFEDRARGAFVGLALGDAYGRPLEFVELPAVRHVEVAVVKDQFMWTDDTHMALFLGRAVLDLEAGEAFDRGVFGHAVGARFVEWLHDPLTPTTAPGGTCLRGAQGYEASGAWESSGDPASDGCGAVMRVCPLPIAYGGDELTTAAEVSALVTHAHPNALEASIAASHLVRWLLEGGALTRGLVMRAASELREGWGRGGMVAESLEAAAEWAETADKDGWLDEKAIPEGGGGWRSPSALGLAVAAALVWGDDFEVAIEKAARIAGDSDSVACLTGMLLGAQRGVGGLPMEWRRALPLYEDILEIASDLVRRSRAVTRPLGTVRVRTSADSPIEVAWLRTPGLPGRIGLTFAPGKKGPSLMGPAWERDLGTDLDRLVGHHGVQLLVPLVEDRELREFQIEDLATEAEARGIVVLRLPIVDGAPPPDRKAAVAAADVAIAFARAGRTAVFHCRGGLGRAGTLAACALLRLGESAEEAMRRVRRVRPGAIENAVQERFLVELAAELDR